MIVRDSNWRRARFQIAVLCGCLALTSFAADRALAQLKAFPQAEGFGAEATGGRGGSVYHVTSLADTNTVGTLRYGLTTFSPSAPVTVVFDVGGWIDLTTKLGITRNNVTIAGQTAPGGIGIRGAQMSIGGDDIVVRHMRFRPGKATNVDHDSLNTNENAQRVIYDHISAEFSTDGGFDLQADDVTLQYSSVSYGLISHSTGALIQSPTGGAAGSLTFHHNLWGHNETRNPKARAEIIDWRDNVVYNFHNGFLAGESETDVNPNWRANFDGNTYISNVGGSGRPMMTGGRTQNYDLYYGVNALDRDGDTANDPIVYTRAEAMADQSVVSSQYNWMTTPFAAAEVWQNANPAEAYARVLAEFGATPWARDEVNSRLASDVINRTGARISNESSLAGISNGGFGTLGGGTLPTDTDNDGMPDAWETKHGLRADRPTNNGDFDIDGFTDLEEYINELAAFKSIGPIEFLGAGRYAKSENWTRRWEPTRFDEIHINNKTVGVDAVGQHAGLLKVGNVAGQTGALNITSGWLEVADELVVGVDPAATATVNVTGGTLATKTLSKGTGGAFDFNLTGGVLHAETVNFDLENEGGTIAPGKSALLSPGQNIGQTQVNGDLTLTAGTLAIELASLLQFDTLSVDGDVLLGGTLNVTALAGFTPQDGDSWQIIAADGLLGNFSSVTEGYSVLKSGGNLILNFGAAVAPLAGDYNDDGMVDASDYTVWRDAVGTTGELLNETETLGVIDGADYDAWKDNFGASSLSEGSGGVSVPEPTTLLLFALASQIGALLLPRRRSL